MLQVLFYGTSQLWATGREKKTHEHVHTLNVTVSYELYEKMCAETFYTPKELYASRPLTQAPQKQIPFSCIFSNI